MTALAGEVAAVLAALEAAADARRRDQMSRQFGIVTLAEMAMVTGLGMWKGALGKDIPAGLGAGRDRVTDRDSYRRATAAMPRP